MGLYFIINVTQSFPLHKANVFVGRKQKRLGQLGANSIRRKFYSPPLPSNVVQWHVAFCALQEDASSNTGPDEKNNVEPSSIRKEIEDLASAIGQKVEVLSEGPDKGHRKKKSRRHKGVNYAADDDYDIATTILGTSNYTENINLFADQSTSDPDEALLIPTGGLVDANVDENDCIVSIEPLGIQSENNSADTPLYVAEDVTDQTVITEKQRDFQEPDMDSTSNSMKNVGIPHLAAKLSEVRNRRRRISQTSGKEAILRATARAESRSPVQENGITQVLEEAEDRIVDEWTAKSTASAIVLPVFPKVGTNKYNALTSISSRLISLGMEVPRSCRPFPALYQAFCDANSVPCSLCNRKTLKSNLQEGFLCSQCYSEIFLEMPSLTSDLPRRKVLDTVPSHVRKAVENVLNERKQLRRMLNADAYSQTPRDNVRAEYKVSPRQDTTSSRGASLAKGSKLSSQDFSCRSLQPPAPPPREDPASNARNDEWNVSASDRSLRTINPIRILIQDIDVKPNPAKELIKLSVGDPTVYGNLRIGNEAVNKFCEVIRSCKSNGYSMSMGSVEAREAVAARYSLSRDPLCADDVVLTAGTSGALEIAIGALANEGDNILLPQPGFPLFRTIAEGFGVECKFYRVLPNRKWEIDLEHVATLADSKTRAIVINNPSNPCGSVYSKSHIQDLLTTASRLRLPIIADEVYADMVFSGHEFTSVASQSVDVPVLSVGGISKQFVAPGWRLGWILIHDRNDIFENGQVRKGIRQLTTRMLVPNTPAQAVLPTLLKDGVKNASFRKVMHELELNAAYTVKALAPAAGIRCIEPQGSMYAMAEIDVNLLGFKDDMDFTKTLLQEESVFVLPGQCFQASNFVRIVFCAPQFILSEAFHRIRSFCARHAGSL